MNNEYRDCDTCQNKHLDYGFFCVDCEPYSKDQSKSNYEDMHEDYMSDICEAPIKDKL